MPAVLVDSNVLLDVLTEDPVWCAWSAQALAEAGNTARLVINPIVYAEISVRFEKIEALEAALLPDLLVREALPYEAAFLTGKVFLSYRKNGGKKTTPLPDFFIGAHAAVAGYQLLTRDPTRFRTYFPKLQLIAPSDN